MSIEFTVLCTRSPTHFLREPAELLEWDPDGDTGSFGALELSLRGLEAHDPLPDPSWAARVVAVIHVEGHITDDGHYDAFDDWSLVLVQRTEGALYSAMQGQFIYTWPDVAGLGDDD